MGKPNTYFVIMRAQGFHLGHKALISEMARFAKYNQDSGSDEIIILVGSANQPESLKNPFSSEMRTEMIYRAMKPTFDRFGSNWILGEIDDIGVGDNADWGDYVLNKVREYSDFKDSNLITFSGEENVRTSWYRPGTVEEIFIPKIKGRGERFSATRCRQLLLDNCESEWREMTPHTLWDYYDWMRDKLLSIKEREETK